MLDLFYVSVCNSVVLSKCDFQEKYGDLSLNFATLNSILIHAGGRGSLIISPRLRRQVSQVQVSMVPLCRVCSGAGISQLSPGHRCYMPHITTKSRCVHLRRSDSAPTCDTRDTRAG